MSYTVQVTDVMHRETFAAGNRGKFMTHPALSAGRTAVVTGAASGIGLATCKRLAAVGMNVCLVDITEVALDAAAKEVRDITEDRPPLSRWHSDHSDSFKAFRV